MVSAFPFVNTNLALSSHREEREDGEKKSPLFFALLNFVKGKSLVICLLQTLDNGEIKHNFLEVCKAFFCLADLNNLILSTDLLRGRE